MFLALSLLACSNSPPTTHAEPDTDSDTDTDTDSDTDSDTDADSDTDTDTDTDTVMVEGYVRVDDGLGTVVTGGECAAIGPDGTLYVAWVDEGRTSERDVYLARSTDGGATWGVPERVDGAGVEPIVTMARHPWLEADGSRVVVSFADFDGQPWIYVADVGPTLSFTGTRIGADVSDDFMDFPRARIAPDGEIWVTFHAYPASGAGEFVARESSAFAAVRATSGADGVPCECCPHDLVFTEEGAAVLAYRNNVDDDRDMWTAHDAEGDGTFDAWTEATTGEGMIAYCPMEGPRLQDLGGGDLRMVWTAAGGAAYGDLRMARSSDDGATWDAERSLPGLDGLSYQPSIAKGVALWVADAPDDVGRVLSSSDGWSTWSKPEVLETGSGPLTLPSLADGAGRVIVVGATEAGAVFARRLE